MIAERVHEVLKPAFHLPGIDGMSITVSASIGIAVGDRPSAEDLLRDADIALYRAKERAATSPCSSSTPCSRRPRSGSPSSRTWRRRLSDNEFSLSTTRSSTWRGLRSKGRSAPPLGAPDPGHPPARRLRPGARGAGPHRRRRPVGAQRGLPGGGGLAPPGSRHQHVGERLHAAARVRPAGRRRPRRTGPRARPRHAHPGGHRVHPDAGLRRHRGPAQPA